MTDEEIMQNYINGDVEAFHILYHRHKGRVLGYLNSRLESQDEAEDVFQEVFTKLHKYRFKYKKDIPFLPWLFTVVKNTLIDHIRKNATRNKHIQLGAEQINNAQNIKEENLSIAEAISELSSLSNKQRQAIELRFNDDLSFEDIAIRMNTSQTNVRKIVSRAIQKLRGLMLGKEK
ncbi:sigma-70 family RNA polymerase sigma factor [Candidatus Pacearchaeota archaeon]|nr:sigma-70 family RNA polymerase sigma factor [Candidatus Pacearchaeota archaeon]